MDFQRISGAFNYLVKVGIVEVYTFKFAFHQAAGLCEVIDSAGLLTLFKIVSDSYLTVCLNPRCPEVIGNRHIRERNSRQIVRLLYLAACQNCEQKHNCNSKNACS